MLVYGHASRADLNAAADALRNYRQGTQPRSSDASRRRRPGRGANGEPANPISITRVEPLARGEGRTMPAVRVTGRDARPPPLEANTPDSDGTGSLPAPR